MRITDTQVEEAPGAQLLFEVALSSPARQTVTVDYATSDGSARAGQDYTATSGTLTFALGTAVKTVAVEVLDDAIDEGHETIRLQRARGQQPCTMESPTRYRPRPVSANRAERRGFNLERITRPVRPRHPGRAWQTERQHAAEPPDNARRLRLRSPRRALHLHPGAGAHRLRYRTRVHPGLETFARDTRQLEPRAETARHPARKKRPENRSGARDRTPAPGPTLGSPRRPKEMRTLRPPIIRTPLPAVSRTARSRRSLTPPLRQQRVRGVPEMRAPRIRIPAGQMRCLPA